MRHKYTLDIVFLLLVFALSLAGFSSLFVGAQAGPNGYQYLHIITSLAWHNVYTHQNPDFISLMLLRESDRVRHDDGRGRSIRRQVQREPR